MESITLMWLIIVVVALLIEATTFALVSIWIALGALCAMFVSMFTDSIMIQLVVFVVVTIASLLGTRPFVKKFLNMKKEKTNLDGMAGKEGIVLEDITDKKPGYVKSEGKMWTAISDEEIKEGEKVKVLEIQGVKLKVERMSDK